MRAPRLPPPGGPAVRARTVEPQPAPVSPHEQSSAIKQVGAVAERGSEPEEEAVVAVPPRIEDQPPPVIDEAAEAEFLAGAKERGETVTPKRASEIEEPAPKQLPPLDDLVAKIPAEVKDALEDLFRARWTTVKKFPKRSLKDR